MRNLLACTAMAVFAPLAALAAEPPLFHLAVAGVPVENGKILDMAFQETSREPDVSLVTVTRRSGGSVSTAMFIVRGMCGMTRVRGKQAFISERIAGEDERYKVTFTDTAAPRSLAFTMAECELMRF